MQYKKSMTNNSNPIPSLLTADSIVDVQKVEFVGVDRTQLSFFERELKEANIILRDQGTTTLQKNEINIKSNISGPNGNVQLADILKQEKFIPTLRNVHGALQQFTAKMLNSDMFEFIDTNLQIDDSTAEKFPAKVIVTLKEKGVPYLRTQAYIKAGKESDSGVEVVAALRNPTGNGETIKVGTVGKPTGGQEFLCNLTVPHIGERSGPFLLTLKSTEENQFYHSSLKQHVTSLTAEYTHDPKARHHFSAEYAIRDEIPMLITDEKPKNNLLDNIGATEQSFQRQASAAVLASAMSSVKTSLKYVWNAVDTRNSPANPTTGEYLQTAVELALPPGNAQFLKTDITTQFHRQLGPDYREQPGLTFSFVSSIGLLYPLSVLFPSFYYNKTSLRASTSPLTSFLSDRYHLGGPLSLRGFDTSGIGPKDSKSIFSQIGQSNDSLGGDTKSTFLAFLSVPIPIPALATTTLRAFWFVNAGSLGNSNYWKVRVLEKLKGGQTYQTSELKGRSSPLFGYMRASIGSGISMSFQNLLRLEATYSVPILSSQNDRLKDFQLGVGLSIN